MNSDDIKKAASDAAANTTAWTRTHPDAVKVLAGIMLGILIGWFLFAR